MHTSRYNKTLILDPRNSAGRVNAAFASCLRMPSADTQAQEEGATVQRVVCLAAIVLVLLAGKVCAQNLAANPDFEYGPPPGPGVAESWMPYAAPGPPPEHFVMDAPWAVYSGSRSQMWMSPTTQRGGVFQVVDGLEPGDIVYASVYFGDPDPLGPFGPTRFRMGIDPHGGPPDAPTIVWSAWKDVTNSWQIAEVQTTAAAPNVTLVLESTYSTTGGAGYQFPPPHNRVIVDNAVLVPVFRKIDNVPDENPPLEDPLGTDDTTNCCGPVAAANITEYWDVVKNHPNAAGVNAGMSTKTVPGYIGYWMDTNDDGCPYRSNGVAFPSAQGTYVADIAPGLAQYVRWDAGSMFADNSFGCTPPPNLPAGKKGYSWTVQTTTRTANNLQGLWNLLVNETLAGRPMLITWTYWKLVDTGVVTNGVRFYTWDAPTGQVGDEKWNSDSNPTAGPGIIGHIVTSVGYWTNHSYDGVAAKTNWVIVHDNWPDTAVDVAVPWQNAAGFSPWAAGTSVKPFAPNTAALTVGPGARCPKDHWGKIEQDNVMIQLKLTETSGTEAVLVNAIRLTAFGTGDDSTDISNVTVYRDENSDGKLDQGDTLIASSGGGYPADNGVLTIIVNGPGHEIPAGAARNILIVYTMSNAGSHGDTYWFGIPVVFATGKNSHMPIQPTYAVFMTPKKKLSTLSVDPDPKLRIAHWKSHRDGTYGIITGSPVVSAGTGRFEKKIYVQEDDGSAGIQVYFGDEETPVIPEGMKLEFEAYIDTMDGERALVQPVLHGLSPSAPIEPVGLSNRDLCGGDWLFDPQTGAGQRGATDACGLNNVGLLVRTWGRVANTGEGFVIIEDGSGTGVRVDTSRMTGQPAPGDYVSVTGIASVYQPSAGMGWHRMTLPRSQSDVVTFEHPSR